MTARETGPTPGPWSVEQDDSTLDDGMYRLVIGDGVAVVECPNEDDARCWQADADADLIAAVPDLLAAAEAVLARFAAGDTASTDCADDPTGRGTCADVDALAEAVRRARGKSRHAIPCGRCGARDEIVNKCGCDPDNLPTRASSEGPTGE